MLNEILNEYLKLYPGDRQQLGLLIKQVKAKGKMDDRNNFTGHVVSGAVIFSPDYQKILLIYHPTFKQWQQPGGHWDPGEDGPWIAAEREAIEETGVKIRQRLSFPDVRIPMLIESHQVPTGPPKNEPLHYHHNFWYSFVALSEKLQLDDEVIKKAKWIALPKIKSPFIQLAAERTEQLIGLKP